jgi:hypothetical protein
MTHTEESLKIAIQYADTRWSGVDVPIEWARHFADALAAQPAQEPIGVTSSSVTHPTGLCTTLVHSSKPIPPDTPIYTTPQAQPAQEPVAWMREDATLRFAEGKVFAVGQPFYTTPQQRPWVGLTDREKSNLWLESRAAIPRFHTYASLVEAKLKEVNQ